MEDADETPIIEEYIESENMKRAATHDADKNTAVTTITTTNIPTHNNESNEDSSNITYHITITRTLHIKFK